MRERIIALLPLILFLGCARPGPGGDRGRETTLVPSPTPGENFLVFPGAADEQP
jgi:hypothetical protein